MSSKKLGYYHGRFQPFHKGHLSMVKQMLENHDEIVIGISNPFRAQADFTNEEADELKEALLKTRDPENNPWSFWQRVLMIRNSLSYEEIDLGRVIIIPNLSNSGFLVDEVRFPKEISVIYTMPSGVHNKIFMDKYRKQGWEVVEINPETRITSGTKIRKLIKDNNFEELEKNVPKGTLEFLKQDLKNETSMSSK